MFGISDNNIHLLEPVGQFGSRIEGGKDSAQPRYIHTHLSPITMKLYDKRDEPLLKNLEDDGQKVEPEYYIPIIPMILINGCTAGIGTGWSCNIPSFNPILHPTSRISKLLSKSPKNSFTMPLTETPVFDL